jgi:glyoxylase-like metal-dependent hydrolase (beta-lactamase superfamily II)
VGIAEVGIAGMGSIGIMYIGNTHVGGPAQVRELPKLTISKISVGSFNNNSYLLRCTNTGTQVLIDAAAEPDRLLTLIGPGELMGVLTTHGHRDHWGALAEVINATGARTFAPDADVIMMSVSTDHALGQGSTVTFGDVTVQVITTGGHTPGASMFIYEDPFGHSHLFSGDCLFPGGVGKTSNPEDFATLFHAVQSQVFEALPDTTWVYPGHGADTHVGKERGSLGEWRARGW